jgi:hypothetical protein
MKHTKLSIAIAWFLLTTVCLVTQARRQEPSNQAREAKTLVSGTVVSEKGLPVKAAALELYMVVEGLARDAYGNPLKGAINIGPNRQVIALIMFPVKTNTDASGQFSMEMPSYFLVPSGLRLIGWTIVNFDASQKVHKLNLKGDMVTFLPKAQETRVELGKLTISAHAVDEK